MPVTAAAAAAGTGYRTGRRFYGFAEPAPPHDFLSVTGGSIGFSIPVAVGAAIACPDRKVIVLESDGSGMYAPQALWTHAREQLNILTIVFANRTYQILRNEMSNVGVTAVGATAGSLMDIGNPSIDWVSLARTFGLEAFRAATTDELFRHLQAGLAVQGPALIEVTL